MLCDKPRLGWDPLSSRVQNNQIAAYDGMRQRCPIAYSDALGWSLFRHADVMRVLHDHAAFSNQVSSHVSVPNGMDPPQHTAYRTLVEQCFADERVNGFEPVCRGIAARLIQALPARTDVDLMQALARPFAVAAQSAYLGWPDCLQQPLLDWVARQQDAARAGDRAALEGAAYEFDGYIRALLAHRREAPAVAANQDLTAWLMAATVDGRPLADEAIVSILRNWTVGELGTMAACVGILVHFLATHQDVQDFLRDEPGHLPAAMDEILRIHAPLISNRRVSTRQVEIGGQRLEAGERVSVLWASANRDEAVFGDPEVFRLDRDPSLNLLYGAGIHVCPGAGLARMELRVVVGHLLAQACRIQPGRDAAPVRAAYPASGFSFLPIRMELD